MEHQADLKVLFVQFHFGPLIRDAPASFFFLVSRPEPPPSLASLWLSLLSIGPRGQNVAQ